MSVYQTRREQLAQRFGEAKVDALLVTSLKNIRYLTGFTGSSAFLIVEADNATIVTDPRYDIQVRQQVDCRTKVSPKPVPTLETLLQKLAVRHLGIEAAHLTVHEFNRYRAALPKTTRLVSTAGLVETLRSVKSPEEIDVIRRAVNLNSQAYANAVARVKPGITEQDVAAEIDHQMRLLGAEGPAFETIVASGPNTALPHARPSAKTLENNELLLIDMGSQVEGYASDMTRMLHLGEPDRRTKQLYRSVLDAQLAAINAIRNNVRASAVDRVARRTLATRQLDRFFTHSTGHGLGLDIHEMPRIGRTDKSVLRTGMAITVEPGVYVEGKGGIRIEDTVLVTDRGCEVLTPTSKELLVI